MKPWLFVGAKVVCVDPGTPDLNLEDGRVYTVIGVGEEVGAFNGIVCGGLTINLAETTHSMKCRSRKFDYAADRFKPLIDNSKTVEAMKQMMRDHVNGASGGLGIGRKVTA